MGRCASCASSCRSEGFGSRTRALAFYQPVAQRAGMPLAYIGVVAAGFNLFAAALLASSAQLERLLGIRRLLLVTAAAPAVLFAVLAWTRSLWVIVPAIFLLVGCKLVRAPVLTDLVNRHVESGNRATVISSISLLERGITFVLYPVIGRIADMKLAGTHVLRQASSDRGLDLALYTLAALCAAFALATRLSPGDSARDPGVSLARPGSAGSSAASTRLS